MGIEDIEVRITKSGEIYVRIEGAAETRIQDYKAFLEESVGPISSAEIIRHPDWDRPAGWIDQDEEQRRRRDQELGRR